MRRTLIDAKIVCAPQVHVHNFINYLAVFFNTSHSNNVDILHIQNMNSKIFVTKNSFMDLLFNSVAGVLCRCGIVPNVGIYYLPSSSWEPGDLRIIIFSALKTFQLLIYNGEIIKHGRMAWWMNWCQKQGLYYFPVALKETNGTFYELCDVDETWNLEKLGFIWSNYVHSCSYVQEVYCIAKSVFAQWFSLVSNTSIDPRCRLVRGQTATVIVVS